MEWLIKPEEVIHQCRVRRRHEGMSGDGPRPTSPALPVTEWKSHLECSRTRASLQGAKIGKVRQINVFSGKGNAT